ncbi:MAG: hypothetical protein IPP74_08320 [Alphaproteobacteria bacterium]|nr:hypothetical protein [Alphaproteobacteria bacterium]
MSKNPSPTAGLVPIAEINSPPQALVQTVSNVPEPFVHNSSAKLQATVLSTLFTFYPAKGLDTLTGLASKGAPIPSFLGLNAKIWPGMSGFLLRFLARQAARVANSDNLPRLLATEIPVNAFFGTYLLQKSLSTNSNTPITFRGVAEGGFKSLPLVGTQSIVFLGSALLYDKLFPQNGTWSDQIKKTGVIASIDTIVNLLPSIATSEIQTGKSYRDVYEGFKKDPEALMLRIKRTLPARFGMCAFGAATYLGTLELTKRLNTPEAAQFVEKSINALSPSKQNGKTWQDPDDMMLAQLKKLPPILKQASSHTSRCMPSSAVSEAGQRFMSVG